jgi:predicted nucleic acid-binding protein
LYVWAYRRPDPRKVLKNIDELLEDEVRLLDFDRECANEFGRVRIDLRRQGIEVPTTDLMIGSEALIYDLTLVTHNVADYQRIPGLRIETWLSP